MAARTDRIEARIEPERTERIRFAASLAGESMSSFIVRAALDRAEEVISAHHQYTVVSSEYFDELLAWLDEPPVLNEVLARAAKRHAENPVFIQR